MSTSHFIYPLFLWWTFRGVLIWGCWAILWRLPLCVFPLDLCWGNILSVMAHLPSPGPWAGWGLLDGRQPGRLGLCRLSARRSEGRGCYVITVVIVILGWAPFQVFAVSAGYLRSSLWVLLAIVFFHVYCWNFSWLFCHLASLLNSLFVLLDFPSSDNISSEKCNSFFLSTLRSSICFLLPSHGAEAS